MAAHTAWKMTIWPPWRWGCCLEYYFLLFNFIPMVLCLWKASKSRPPAWRLLPPPLPPAWRLLSHPKAVTQQWLPSILMQLTRGGQLGGGFLCSSAGPWRQPCCRRRRLLPISPCLALQRGRLLAAIRSFACTVWKVVAKCYQCVFSFFFFFDQGGKSNLPLYFEFWMSSELCLRFLCISLSYAIYFLGLTPPGIKR